MTTKYGRTLPIGWDTQENGSEGKDLCTQKQFPIRMTRYEMKHIT